MPSLHIKTELHFDELLKVVGQLNTRELEQLMSQVISLRAKRKSPCLSQKETALFLNINKRLPSKTRTRFDVLNKKRQAETLTDSEHKELLRLTEQIEKFDSKRIGYMAELARIRGVSLTKLMKNTEIFPSAHG